jgi:hypothetical protein
MKYHPTQKTAILEKLRANGGDIAVTHLQTGVPERTLRDWRRERWLQSPPPPPPTPLRRRQNDPDGDAVDDQPAQAPDQELPVFEDDLDALAYLRRQIVDELVRIAGAFQDTFQLASPYQRVNMLAQLMDRLMKLDERLKPYKDEMIVRVIREDRPPSHFRTEGDTDTAEFSPPTDRLEPNPPHGSILGDDPPS